MSYYTEQLGRLNQDPADPVRDEFAVMVQFKSINGTTNWMNITPDQLRKMGDILLESIK